MTTETSVSLPRYVRYREWDNVFIFEPPKKAAALGVTRFKRSRDVNEIIEFANKANPLIDEWRKSRDEAKAHIKDGRVGHLINQYLNSTDYAALASVTKEGYKNYLMRWQHCRIGGVEFHNAKLDYLTPPLAQRLYEQQLKATGSVEQCGAVCRILSICYNWGIRHGYVTINPWRYVKKQRLKPRKVMWERENVLAFLNTAFSEWKWRNAGILVYCLYEWGQRVGDICRLHWDQVDMTKRSVTIVQSKRGAKVVLPISDGLHAILQQQWKQFPCRHLVAPRMRRVNSDWVGYSPITLSLVFNDIKEAAKLPAELQMRDLRRTAITETIENGADLLTVMMLSGHRAASSVTPYFVHTLKGSTKAQEIRQFPAQLLESNVLEVPRYGKT